VNISLKAEYGIQNLPSADAWANKNEKNVTFEFLAVIIIISA
jgi:hypothetical protein